MAVTLNQKGFEFVRQMIQQGQFNTEGDWASNQPSAEEGDAFLANNSYDEYGKWFLGVNPDTDPNTKEHYEFPVGNFKQIFRSGVIAAEQRAGQYHHEDIKAAAKELLDMMPG